jgi:hypothetical protein
MTEIISHLFSAVAVLREPLRNNKKHFWEVKGYHMKIITRI